MQKQLFWKSIWKMWKIQGTHTTHLKGLSNTQQLYSTYLNAVIWLGLICFSHEKHCSLSSCANERGVQKRWDILSGGIWVLSQKKLDSNFYISLMTSSGVTHTCSVQIAQNELYWLQTKLTVVSNSCYLVHLLPRCFHLLSESGVCSITQYLKVKSPLDIWETHILW